MDVDDFYAMPQENQETLRSWLYNARGTSDTTKITLTGEGTFTTLSCPVVGLYHSVVYWCSCRCCHATCNGSTIIMVKRRHTTDMPPPVWKRQQPPP